MNRASRAVLSVVVAGSLVAAVAPASAGAQGASAARVRTGAAPGGPGKAAPFLPADKSGFGTSNTRASDVWYTLPPGGGTSELYYPDLGTPAARRLGFVIVSPDGSAVQAAHAARHHTQLVAGRTLTYRETDTGRHRAWRLVTTYVTDPDRSALRVDVRFSSPDERRYRLYTVYEPTLSNTPSDDSGRTRGHTLVAWDARAASALRSAPAFTATSNGFRGVNDGWRDLRADGRMNDHYGAARDGNIVQTARTTLTGRGGHQRLVLTLGFGRTRAQAVRTAHTAAERQFARVAGAYAQSWRSYLRGLDPIPPSLHGRAQRTEYRVSEMMLAAAEDKRHPGAYVASPTMPWVWGAENPTGPYHLVWSRDLYEIATALIADGDRAGANRALSFLFDEQQKSDGSFPQNSTVTGKPFWGGLQLDEVADPIVLAYQLHRFGRAAYRHVKAAADFLVGFSQDGNSAPWSPQDRWENQSGYSPATIASEVAGLVCAAAIARHNGDSASARRWLRTADAWKSHVKRWTVTTNGPYSPKPYFLRLTKDGHPDRGTTYSIGDSGPSNADQRSVVDPSFLELVRLGVLPAGDRAIRNSVKVVDEKLSYRTSRGRFWHRASFDGYGETSTGAQWTYDNPPDSFVTHGRGWPLLNGERGEYDLAAGRVGAAARQLATMGRAANSGYLLPEQVWDRRPPAGQPGYRPGTPTFSATPLIWTHAQFIRLAADVAARRVVEQPGVVAKRYVAQTR